MIKNILKKDLKRKKTMNIIILMFVILASMFVASSVNNIITVINGAGYFFEKANIGNYDLITMGQNVVGNLDEVLSKEDCVQEYRTETVIFGSQDNFKANGKKVQVRNSALIQSLDDAQENFFDENNKKVSTVESGKVYITGGFMKENDLKVGDTISVEHGNVKATWEIAGRLKDAMLGSTFMGNPRFLISREDYELFEADELLREYYRGEVCYITTSDEKGLSSVLSEIDGIAFDGSISLIRMCYVMDMVIAGLLIVVSICLIIVAFVVLKFTITFTLNEEFREIGVMKAIGITDTKIRSIYVVKYLAIAIFGAILGLFGSIPFGNIMMKSVSENMVLGNDKGIIINICSVLVVVLLIVWYAYFCTGKIRKYSPIDAIRSGQSGERFKKKNGYRITKSKLHATAYLAMNDILSNPKRYLTIVLAFTICSILVFMCVNTTETLKSDRLVYTFGKPSDAYCTNVYKAMSSMSGNGKDTVYDTLDEIEAELAEYDIPAKASVEMQFKYKVEFDGEIYKLGFQQGYRTQTTDYVYYEGEAPQNEHEIAITEQISQKIGAKIGDTLKITIGDQTDDYLITAYFESMNQMGEIIRLHEDVMTNAGDSSSMLSFQIDFTDHPTQQVIDERVEEMKDIFDCDEVFNAAEYTEDCVGVVDTMQGVEYLLLIITIIVVILVAILMERSFISDEKGEIAILKAIGFSDNDIMKWHVLRFVIVSISAVFLGVILSVPVTNLAITPIFGMMGMHSVSFEYNLFQICLLFPGIILAVTILAAGLTALYTRTIRCRDTAGIE